MEWNPSLFSLKSAIRSLPVRAFRGALSRAADSIRSHWNFNVGENLTLWTIRLALSCCLVSWLLRLLTPRSVRGTSLARAAWLIGCICYLAHVAFAFHFYHEWSHDLAFRHTARQTQAVVGWNWGGGLFINYLFTLVWSADVLWQWLAPLAHRSRSKGFELAIHGFFLFMIVNGTIVFGAGSIRWCGAAGLVALLAAWRLSRRRSGAC